MDKDQVHAAIRQAGGIVHSDGNIFFTNQAKFLEAAVRAMQEQQAGVPAGHKLMPLEPTPDAVSSIRDACPSFITAETARRIYCAAISTSPSGERPTAPAGAEAQQDAPVTDEALKWAKKTLRFLLCKSGGEPVGPHAEFERAIVRLSGVAAPAGAEAQQDAPADEWERAQAICDLPAVDEAIRNLLEDNTGDNATCLVREVLRAALPAEGEKA